MKFLKKLFSRKSHQNLPPPVAHSDDKPHPVASSLSQRERVGVRESRPNENPPPIQYEGDLKPDCGLRTVDSGLQIDPDNKRNGKIARLPRDIREKINECLASGQSAVSIARQLNQLPEVKSVLQTHFGGRPILPQNLSEWRAGGYRAWLLRQEMLHQQKELAADASEMGKIAQGMADSLLRMLELDYAYLLKNRHNETPEEFEKKRKALSIMIKDVAKLCHCEHQNRSVEVQEGRLEQHREKSVEEVHGKFMGWARHPGVRKAFFLEPQACDAQMRAYHDLPLTLEDQALLKELGLKEAEFRSRVKSAAEETESAKAGEKRKNQTKRKPSQTENSSPEPQRGSVAQPGVAPKTFGATPGLDPNNSPNPVGVGSTPAIPPPSESPASAVVATDPQDQNVGPATSSLSQRERVGVRESRPNENPVPVQSEGELKPSGRQSTPIKVGQAPHACAPDAPSSDSGPRTVDSGLKSLLPPKMPLTAYQEAINEGKSPEEAEAASKYCSPAKRAQRRREYEQYRKDLAAYEAQVNIKPAITPVFHNPSQLSGFSPHQPQPTYHSPLGEIHHPSDRWTNRYS